jgi:hypothetical protein
LWNCNCWVFAKKISYFKKKLDYNKENIEADEILKNNALIRFYFHENPDKLSDSEWCKRVAELDYCLEYNGVRIKKENG